MKRMNEVFELPINGRSLPGLIEDDTTRDDDIAIAHAINHVDALADALGCILMIKEDELFDDWIDKESPSGDVESVQSQFEDSPVFKDFIAEFGGAIAALKAYRGEK